MALGLTADAGPPPATGKATTSDHARGHRIFMIPHDFPGRGKVAVLKTQPETVLQDVGEAMRLAGFQEALPRDKETLLKINISWQTWYPACSTTPWQLEG